MRKFEAVVLAAIVGAVLMGLARSQDFGRLSRELKEAEDSIAALVPKIAQLTEQADSLALVAHKADTVRVEVERIAYVEVDRAREDGRAAADSLRATLDSVQSVMLANVEANHEAEVAAVQRIADARLAWGESWRTLAITQDSLISAQAAQLALSSALNAGLRSALVAERQQVWLSRSAAVLGVVAVLVLK